MVLDERPVMPGEKLAVVEEFEPGRGAYERDGVVRALTLGTASYDMDRRVVEVKPLKKCKVPSTGDTVVGQVELVQGGLVNIRIFSVNGEPVEGFTGLLIARSEGRGRKSLPCKPGDVVRAFVVGVENTVIHLSMDRSVDGVVYTRCSICGGDVRRSGSRVRCLDCGNVEERRLASDFGRARF